MKPAKTVRIPQQDRSRDTVEAIVAAAEEILLHRSFHELKLEELVERASCTVGAFYHLFGSKAALRDYLEERFYAGAGTILDRAGAASDELTGVQLLRRLSDEVTELYRDSRGILRALVLAAASDPALDARMTERSRRVADRMADLVLPRMAVAHENPREAIIFALGAVRAVLQRAILFDDASILRVSHQPADLSREVTRMVVSYLTGPEPDVDRRHW